MNKILLKILVGIIAIALAACAAFFSILGLAKLFAGAGLAIICMASTLEASKIVIASFLYQTWDTVNKILRTYLLIAISIVMLITSIGIYGFLSAAYQNTKSKYELSATQSDSLTTKRLYYENSTAAMQRQLDVKNQQLLNLMSIRNSQEQRANQLVNTNKSSFSADKSARQTDDNINKLNEEIQSLNDKIITYSDSASKLKISETQLTLSNELSSELGSLVYISKVLNVSMDKVVNVLIILFIIVFDPLAICLTLAFNFLYTLKKETKESLILTKINNETPVSEINTSDNKEQFISENEINTDPIDIKKEDQILNHDIIQEKIKDTYTHDSNTPEASKPKKIIYAGAVKV